MDIARDSTQGRFVFRGHDGKRIDLTLRRASNKAKWISAEEKKHLEETLEREAAELETGDKAPIWQAFLQPAVFVMLPTAPALTFTGIVIVG